MTCGTLVRAASALDSPVVEPPPIATTQSALLERSTPSACSVTSTGVCMAAPSKRAASSGPSDSPTRCATSSSRLLASRSTRLPPTLSTSARTCEMVPEPKTTRVDRTSWTKGFIRR